MHLYEMHGLSKLWYYLCQPGVLGAGSLGSDSILVVIEKGENV